MSAKMTRAERIARGPAGLATKPAGRTLTAELELVRPLVGGGAVARKLDDVQWLRGTSVRGNLRFWWRAIYGAAQPDLSSLRSREARLFGSANLSGDESSSGTPTAALATLQLETDHGGKRGPWPGGPGDAGTAAYFSSVMPTREALLWSGDAKLCVRYAPGLPSSEAEELDRTVTAWLLLGGAGGRTRRAAGTLVVKGEQIAGLPSWPDSRRAAQEWLAALPRGGNHHDCFSLAHRYFEGIGAPCRTAEQAHNKMLRAWKGVRFAVKQRGKPIRAHLGLPLVGTPFANDARYASPIILSITRVREGFVPIVVATPSRLSASPDGGRAPHDLDQNTMLSILEEEFRGIGVGGNE